jgi:hypothetical protein
MPANLLRLPSPSSPTTGRPVGCWSAHRQRGGRSSLLPLGNLLTSFDGSLRKSQCSIGSGVDLYRYWPARQRHGRSRCARSRASGYGTSASLRTRLKMIRKTGSAWRHFGKLWRNWDGAKTITSGSSFDGAWEQRVTSSWLSDLNLTYDEGSPPVRTCSNVAL